MLNCASVPMFNFQYMALQSMPILPTMPMPSIFGGGFMFPMPNFPLFTSNFNNLSLFKFNTGINKNNGRTTNSSEGCVSSYTCKNTGTSNQRMLDYAKQFNGKTQNEMRQIMTKDKYQFNTGLWCADFVSFVAGKSRGEGNLPTWYKKCNRAYVPSIEDEARKNGAIVAERHGKTIDTSKVKPGNLVIINWQKDNSGVDHVGFVVKIEGNKVYTLEGNVSGHVAYRTRDLSLVHSFVDIG